MQDNWSRAVASTLNPTVWMTRSMPCWCSSFATSHGAGGGVAGRDHGGDLGLQCRGVERADRREGLDVGATGCLLGIGGTGSGAVNLQPHLGVGRQAVDQAVDRVLGGVD